MRTYLILKEKARQFNQDAEIQALLKEINSGDAGLPGLDGKYSRQTAEDLKGRSFDRVGMGRRGYGYERLDQLTVELLMGVR
jgi:xylose isomerase